MILNVGKLDRLLRLVIGAVLVALPFVSNIALFENGLYKNGAIIVGIVLLVTAAMRFCPIYRIFGIRTCPIK